MSEYQFRIVPTDQWHRIETSLLSNMPIPGIDKAGLMFFDSLDGTQSAALIDATCNGYLVEIRHVDRSATVFPTGLTLKWMLDDYDQRRLWIHFIGQTRESLMKTKSAAAA